MKNKIPLSTQFISLVEQGQLEKIKHWVQQTNIKNMTYILEDKEISKEEGYKYFYYWDVGTWTIEIASQEGFLDIIEYVFNSPEYQHKPSIQEEIDGSSPILTASKDRKTLEYLIKNGSFKSLSYVLKRRFEDKEIENILLGLVDYFVETKPTEIALFIAGLKENEDENDFYQIENCQKWYSFTQSMIDKAVLNHKLNNTLISKTDIPEELHKI